MGYIYICISCIYTSCINGQQKESGWILIHVQQVVDCKSKTPLKSRHVLSTFSRKRKATQNEENRRRKKHDVRPDISNAAQAINSCANAHMCAFDFWESNSVQLLPLNCWCLIADFHCFSPYYRGLPYFCFTGEGFYINISALQDSNLPTFVMFHGGDSLESLDRVGGKFRESPHFVQVFQTSQGLWRPGPTCVWIP